MLCMLRGGCYKASSRLTRRHARWRGVLWTTLSQRAGRVAVAVARRTCLLVLAMRQLSIITAWWRHHDAAAAGAHNDDDACCATYSVYAAMHWESCRRWRMNVTVTIAFVSPRASSSLLPVATPDQPCAPWPLLCVQMYMSAWWDIRNERYCYILLHFLHFFCIGWAKKRTILYVSNSCNDDVGRRSIYKKCSAHYLVFWTPSYVIIYRELKTFKNGPVFLAHPVYYKFVTISLSG